MIALTNIQKVINPPTIDNIMKYISILGLSILLIIILLIIKNRNKKK
jgi:Co/Zn/Cd efflux system component